MQFCILFWILIFEIHWISCQFMPPPFVQPGMAAFQFQSQPRSFPGQGPLPPHNFPFHPMVGPPSMPTIPNQVIQPLIIEYATIAPDNFPQRGIVINGRFPGPPIRVKWYDTLIVEVTNKLDHGITLHFHGIRNYQEPDAEGVAGVTQELIPPGGIFRYLVKIGFQTGTFIYHLHTGLDSIWAFGPLIIEDGPELLAPFKEYFHIWDYTIILSQCWHTPISELEDALKGNPSYKYLPQPQSILLNGKSYGKWDESGITAAEGAGYETFIVKPGQTYRFRVIGFGADSMLTFKIQGHKMRIIAIDGIITKPVEVDHLEVNSGQRYSVLVTMDQEIDNYFIESEMIPGPGPKNGKAILQYEGAVDVGGKMKRKIFSGETNKVTLSRWETSKLSPNPKIKQPDIYLVPSEVDREIVMISEMKNDSKTDTVKFLMNGKKYESATTPLLFQVRQGKNITNEPQVYESLTNKSIQIIFQNVANDDGKCEQHPWHIHGHSFYVVGYGAGKYNEKTYGPKIDDKVQSGRGLVFRDVVTVYPELPLGEDKPANSITGEDKSANNTSGEDYSANNTTGEDKSADNTTGEDKSANNTTGEDNSENSTTGEDNSANSTTGEDVENGAPSNKTAGEDNEDGKSLLKSTGESQPKQSAILNQPKNSTGENQPNNSSAGEDQPVINSTERNQPKTTTDRNQPNNATDTIPPKNGTGENQSTEGDKQQEQDVIDKPNDEDAKATTKDKRDTPKGQPRSQQGRGSQQGHGSQQDRGSHQGRGDSKVTKHKGKHTGNKMRKGAAKETQSVNKMKKDETTTTKENQPSSKTKKDEAEEENQSANKDGQNLENLKPGTPCGWTAVRFVTDNPGVWLVHCHLTAHYILGEEFLIYSYQSINPSLLKG